MAETHRFMLVDDNADDRTLVERELRREFPQASFEHVLDPLVLERALASGPFDAAITDFQLRWSDGLRVLAALHEVDPELPVVMFTGTGSEEVVARAMQAGLEDYVIKTPEHYARLPRAVRRALDRARDRRARRDAERRYRALFDRAPVGLYQATRDGMILEANVAVARIFGAAGTGALPGRNIVEMYARPEDRNRWLARLAKGSVTGFEVQLRRADGAVITVRHSAAVIDGEGAGLCEGVIEDVTERAQAEEALRGSEDRLRHSSRMEAVGRLAGGVAHDFNNMLTVISGHAELLAMRLQGNQMLLQEVKEIRAASERAGSLTRQLLAFSRRQILQPRVVDLNAVARDLEKMLRRLIGEDIDLRVTTADGLGRVKADPGQIEQVLMNLAVNARDAMPEGGKLTIDTRNVELDETYARDHPPTRPGRYVMLAVSDTGHGMDAGVREHLFEPFFTTKPDGKGTGLGLATVYGIVKQSGGYIWVYSEPGEGATFKIYLPRVEDPAEAAAPGPADRAAAAGSETVLVAEDEEVVRDLVEQILKAAGYTVLSAPGPLEALRLIVGHSGAIHLMVTDVVMPGMNGRELARRAAALRPGLRVLFMSGYTDDAIVHRGVLEPGTPFLQKPFTPASLTRKIREVLAAPETSRQ